MKAFISWRDIFYRVINTAGTGGVGKVYLVIATNGPNKGIEFALKVFNPNSREKEGWKQAFMREVHVLRDCHHPAIIKVIDEGVAEENRPFFVMEYLPATLAQAIRDDSLDIIAKTRIVMQLLSALNYLAHRDPYLVHRDIKPKNIFLKADSCVLGDFGLVFQDIEWNRPGQQPGTIPAMARKYRTPELVEYHSEGKKKPPPASDVFQLGLVACELFTGANPLIDDNPLKPIRLNTTAIDQFRESTINEAIQSRLHEMITIETSKRPPAYKLLPLWLDLYDIAINNKNRKMRHTN